MPSDEFDCEMWRTTFYIKLNVVAWWMVMVSKDEIGFPVFATKK